MTVTKLMIKITRIRWHTMITLQLIKKITINLLKRFNTNILRSIKNRPKRLIVLDQELLAKARLWLVKKEAEAGVVIVSGLVKVVL